MSSLILNFNNKKIKKIKNPKYILGGKGANLAEMSKLGLPVPVAILAAAQAELKNKHCENN